ncbi:MAG: tyrosine--tRNA ligase [Alphaproteobacteria bacterium]|nr:tyrosine--tRNA ligase [Alphaproteobacteria bacterium]
MSAARSELLRVLEERQYVHQITDRDALDAKAASARVIAYIGFDCTATSLHVGNLVSIMMLRRLQQTGHKPVVLVGGGTTKIGDPSGKDEARKVLTDADIAANKEGIRKNFASFLKFGTGPTDAVMVDNADWLDRLGYIAFLREFGAHFSVNRMLTMDSVRLRLEREQPLSFLEFNYMVLQAYDFLELSRRQGVTLQMGGSDQWGNIVTGVDLTRKVDGREMYGLTTPLITTAGGAKMGKTAQGAVWLSADKLLPYDYWQFWRNTHDGDVGRFLRLFTDLPLDEIARLEKLEGQELNEAKIALANAATTMNHGEAAARAAEETARKTFEQGTAAEGLPTFRLDSAALAAGIPAFELVFASGLVPSKGEARKLIRSGGVRLNDQVIGNETEIIGRQHLDGDGRIKLSIGKKRHALGVTQGYKVGGK